MDDTPVKAVLSNVHFLVPEAGLKLAEDREGWSVQIMETVNYSNAT